MKRFLIPLSICLISCVSHRETSTELNILKDQTDSVSYSISKIIRPVHVPESSVSLIIPSESIKALPSGAGYAIKEGNAGLSVVKNEDGDLEIRSTCDSILLLLEDKKEELFRLRTLNSELENKSSEIKEIRIREPTGFQWFMIYLGWLFLGYCAYKLFAKKLKIWRK